MIVGVSDLRGSISSHNTLIHISVFASERGIFFVMVLWSGNGQGYLVCSSGQPRD